jgi:hypothetical protein
MVNMNFITPIRDKLDHCLSIGQASSQSLVYALDADIVIKMPFQYSIPDDLDDNAIFYLNYALQSFVAMERKLAVYDAIAIRPHTNIVRKLEVNSLVCLFLERVQPLKQMWPNSNKIMRHC